jgi:V/A-type H+-transporting ATPase subunit A
MTRAPHITRASGALVEVEPVVGSLFEVVRVGPLNLLGEVVKLHGPAATVQVYEDTTGLRVGDPVELSGQPLTISLGPGLLGAILDGVGRPLTGLAASGDFIGAGAQAPTLDPTRRWTFAPASSAGTTVHPGDVIGEVEERPGFQHRILVPPRVSGVIAEVSAGEFTIAEQIGQLTDGTPLRLAHAWPVRAPRPVAQRLAPDRPFQTGQRVFDLLFTVAEGGAVALPGGFGTGKTVVEQSLAKYAQTDVVVYVGCGERGNEMAEVLHDFPKLRDPRTGRSLMERTVLVVNTSNMPVAARESSIHMGMTIAEYFRDQGYRVALMVDSISRWAEALREFGARLQEMPGEEGFPTYLGNRLAQFYERAGRAQSLGNPMREGAVTVISAISPPGGDLSEPVTQAALRVTGALWALDATLAHQRHFPALDWQTSYTLYASALAPWLEREVAQDWSRVRAALLELLQREQELREIAGLIGADALQDRERVLLECARLIREIVLSQSAYDPVDASCPLDKTCQLARAGLRLQEVALAAVAAGAAVNQLDLREARRALLAMRASASPGELDAAGSLLDFALDALGKGAGA